jgi:hypothetical protein
MIMMSKAKNSDAGLNSESHNNSELTVTSAGEAGSGGRSGLGTQNAAQNVAQKAGAVAIRMDYVTTGQYQAGIPDDPVARQAHPRYQESVRKKEQLTEELYSLLARKIAKNCGEAAAQGKRAFLASGPFLLEFSATEQEETFEQ